MDSKKISELDPPHLYRILIYSGCWICGIWSFYHIFSYTRQYFEGLTLFDTIIIILMVPIGILISLKNRTRPMQNIIIGLFGQAISGFYGIFNTPIGYGPDEAPTQKIFFDLIDTEQGAINFGFVLLFSIIITSGMVQSWSWDKIIKRNTMYNNIEWALSMLIAIVISLAIYLSVIFSFGNSYLSPFFCLTLMSSCFLIIIGIIPSRNLNIYYSSDQKDLIKWVQGTPSLSFKTKMVRSLGNFLTWISSSLYIILATFLYHQFSYESNRVINITQFLQSLIIGFVFIIIINFNESLSKLFRKLTPIIIPLSIWSLASICYADELGPYSFEAGMAMAFTIWTYIFRAGNYSRNKLSAVWLIITLMISAYLAFIPSHIEELRAFVEQITIILIIPIILDLISISLLHISPDNNDLKQYVICVPEDIQKKGKKITSELIKKIKEKYENEP